MNSFDRTYRNSGVNIAEYSAVSLDSSGKVAVASAGSTAIGIAQRAVLSEEKAVPVTTGGHTKAVAGGAITAGSRVKVGTGGKLVAVGGEAAGTVVEVIGFAETSTSADGDIFELLLAPHNHTIPSAGA